MSGPVNHSSTGLYLFSLHAKCSFLQPLPARRSPPHQVMLEPYPIPYLLNGFKPPRLFIEVYITPNPRHSRRGIFYFSRLGLVQGHSTPVNLTFPKK